MFFKNLPQKTSWRWPAAAIALLCFSAVFIATQKKKQPHPQATEQSTTTNSSSAIHPPASEFHSASAETLSSTTKPDQQTRPTAESLETLAAQDPSRALAIALAETDLALRETLLQAVLRGWASTAPDTAADWALAQTYLEQGLAMAAVFNGAKVNPATAISLAERLSAQHPADADSYGRYLIFGLTQAGQFELAANFAARSPDEVRTELLSAAYTHWARQQPSNALAAALKLDDPAKQDAAFHATISGWAHLNPQELTATANQLPEGADRILALTSGLRSWIEKDPATASDWISQHKLTAKEAEMVLEE
jgi:hypothetical protein